MIQNVNNALKYSRMFQKYGTIKQPFMSIEIVPRTRKLQQNIGIDCWMNFDSFCFFLYCDVLINRYNKIQSGIMENISWLNIYLRIRPEYRIQYNKKKTINLSCFILI